MSVKVPDGENTTNYLSGKENERGFIPHTPDRAVFSSS